MTVLQSVLPGIVQGITEFLPVSSSGHLVVLRNIFRVQTDNSLLADILLRFGTLTAVLLVYHRDLGRLLSEAFFMIGDLLANLKIRIQNRIHKTSLQYRKIVCNSYRRLFILLLLSAIPSSVIGFAGVYLFAAAGKTLLIPGICFWIMAVLLMMADTAPDGCKLPRGTDCADSLVIGLAHGLAAMPGLSRCGAALTAGILCGMERRFALKYSFLLLVPTNLVVLLLECPAVSWRSMTAGTAGVCLAGIAFTCAAGFACAKVMLRAVMDRQYRVFAAYCVFAGAVAIGGQFFL